MPTVYVGMSGGIDSSAAAYLLKEQGYKVTGITFTAYREEGLKKCCSIEDLNDAKKVCSFLGIAHKVIDVRDVFSARIISNFVKSYRAGLTPNPCVLCNRYVKFGAMLEYSISEGADFFATGHYSRITEKDGEYLIGEGLDPSKDQSYFLSYIEKSKLPYIKLPMGVYLKKDIRVLAEKAGLPISPRKSESQDICFIKDDYRDFLKAQGVPEIEGFFVYKGKIFPDRRGIAYYSFGQRRGLAVAAGERVYIRKFNTRDNTIILGGKPMSKEFSVRSLNIFTDKFSPEIKCDVRFRYQSPLATCKVTHDGSRASVVLEEERGFIAPGQFAVFYKDGYVYASGEIESSVLL
jgi:tRNA-specific 2-thiouridylase